MGLEDRAREIVAQKRAEADAYADAQNRSLQAEAIRRAGIIARNRAAMEEFVSFAAKYRVPPIPLHRATFRVHRPMIGKYRNEIRLEQVTHGWQMVDEGSFSEFTTGLAITADLRAFPVRAASWRGASVCVIHSLAALHLDDRADWLNWISDGDVNELVADSARSLPELEADLRYEEPINVEALTAVTASRILDNRYPRQ